MPKETKTFVGQRYGSRVVTSIIGQNAKGKTQYSFKCDCGYEGIALSKQILRNPRHCDNCKVNNPVDMVGQKTDKWEVVSKDGKNKHGAILFNCRCAKCGSPRQITGVCLRKKEQPICKHCLPPYVPTPRINIVGKTINGWQVLEQCSVNNLGVILYRCVHLNCGNEATKTSNSIRRKEIVYCKNCPPQYSLKSEGAFTSGTLSDGTRFLIDNDMVEDFSERYWNKNSKGYIVSTQRGQAKLYLHRFVLGMDGDVIIDHINRDKTDNRRENLRIVDYAQNSYNKGLQSNSTTGYTGVCWIGKKARFMAHIGQFNKRLTLGYFKDIKEAAAAHNIAAAFLFGDYIGHWNDVPTPSSSFISMIEEKCRRFKQSNGR